MDRYLVTEGDVFSLSRLILRHFLWRVDWERLHVLILSDEAFRESERVFCREH